MLKSIIGVGRHYVLKLAGQPLTVAKLQIETIQWLSWIPTHQIQQQVSTAVIKCLSDKTNSFIAAAVFWIEITLMIIVYILKEEDLSQRKKTLQEMYWFNIRIT